jgi:hypothetical protein
MKWGYYANQCCAPKQCLTGQGNRLLFILSLGFFLGFFPGTFLERSDVAPCKSYAARGAGAYDPGESVPALLHSRNSWNVEHSSR